MGGSTRRGGIIGMALGLVAVAVLAWLWNNRTRVEVVAIDQFEPGVLSVMVGSCNGAPEADVEELGDGRYTVETRTTQAYDPGEECGDIVVIPVDPNRDSFEVVDRVSGDTFVWPEEPVAMADIDGRWRMVEVNGEAVEFGVNTAEIPELTIEAGFLNGKLGCNSGGGELLLDGWTIEAAFIESTMELCTIPDGGEEMVPTERILIALLAEGAELERSGDTMSWSGEAGTLEFERIS